MNIDSAKELLSAVGSVASILSLYSTVGYNNIKDIFSGKKKAPIMLEVEENLTISDSVEFTVKLAQVIKKDILIEIKKAIQNAEKRFKNSINDPRYTPAQVDQEEDILRATVCEQLSRIKRLNRDQIPTSLSSSWSSLRCQDRA